MIQTKMQAVVYEQYGSPEVLQLKQIEKPLYGDHEMLVKIFATTVTATECTFRKGRPFFSRLFTGLRRPKITTLGEEFAGKVVEVGKGVTKFKVGDEVFGTAGPGFGANAEYLAIPEEGVLAIKPGNLGFGEAAATVDGFLTALPFLRDVGRIQSGQKVLIIGASGSVGSAAVQIANHYGADVTAVCSTANVELVRRLGAKKVIDYLKTDFTRGSEKYDIIFDTVGKVTFTHARTSLNPRGVFLEAAIGLGILPHVIWTAMFGSKKAKIAATGLRKPEERLRDLQLLQTLLESGEIVPVVDRSYPLHQIADAHHYVDQGHKKGNVVIDVVEARSK